MKKESLEIFVEDLELAIQYGDDVLSVKKGKVHLTKLIQLRTYSKC